MKTMILKLAMLAALSACNTMEGMGRDIKATGEAISGTAEKTKEEMK